MSCASTRLSNRGVQRRGPALRLADNRLRAATALLFWITGVLCLPAAELVITQLEGGILTWSNSPPELAMFSVEWTHDMLTPQWEQGWEDQSAIINAHPVVSVPVPRFYRVHQGFDNRAFAGPWILYHPNGPLYITPNGRGRINSFGAFMIGRPMGTYQVLPDGQLNMTLYEEESLNQVQGRCQDANTFEYATHETTNFIRRVTNPGALAGIWKGTIYTNYNVVLEIAEDGFIPVISNLFNVCNGSLYVDSSNTVAGAIFTSLPPENVWNRFQIRGFLINGTTIIGDCEPDWESGWLTATVHLQRTD